MSTEMHLIIAGFDTPDGAKNTLKEVKKENLKRGDVAILSKDENGEIKVKETESWNWKVFTGAAVGAAVGSMIPVAGSIIVGGVVGGIITAKLDESGFPKDQLKTMAGSLEPDHSMLVMLVDSGSAPAVERVLAESGGKMISHQLGADLVAELEEAVQEK